MADVDVWRELYRELESDLKNRMDKNCSMDLDFPQTCAVRGEIQYLKTLIGKVRERARII
jgi:hypothetical protein